MNWSWGSNPQWQVHVFTAARIGKLDTSSSTQSVNWSWGSNAQWQVDNFIAARIGKLDTSTRAWTEAEVQTLGGRYTSLQCRIPLALSLLILIYFASSALDAESERLVQEALDRVSKGGSFALLNLKLSLLTYIQLYPKSLFFLRINKTTKCTFSPLECTTCDWSARRLSSDMFSRCRQIRNKTPGCVILFGHFVAFFFRGINAQYSTALQVALFWWLLIDWAQYEMPASLLSSLTERSLR